MHRTKTLSLLSVGALALVAAFMLLLGSFATNDDASAATAPAGTYDILVPDALPADNDDPDQIGLYHCIAAVDKADAIAAMCYADIELGDAGGEPPAAPGEGDDGLSGPPPPPGYSNLAPSEGTLVAADTETTLCFEPLGGGSGPTVIAKLNLDAALGAGTTTGDVDIYFNQSYLACNLGGTPTPKGSPVNLDVELYQTLDEAGAVDGGCDSSWRDGTTVALCGDFDGDGCDDAEELFQTVGTCGDDPYNPYDSDTSDLRGTYTTLATTASQDCDTNAACVPGSGTWNAGAYYHCISVLTTAGPSDIPVEITCYIDIPGVENNPEGHPGCAGDGRPGASPPGVVTGECAGASQWGDTNSKTSVLTADLAGGIVTTTGCFEDTDGMGSLGNVYVDASQDAATGIGTVDIYVAETLANCTAGTPAGTAILNALTVARQSDDLQRDSDNDGCTDHEEMYDGTNAQDYGGFRDPYNRFDHFDFNNDGVVDLFIDIFGVAFLFGADSDSNNATNNPEPDGYVQEADAGGTITGSMGSWNLKGADGLVDLFIDIFGVAFQFGDDCDGTAGP